jgi:hypothetical protein
LLGRLVKIIWALITYSGQVDSAEAEKNYLAHKMTFFAGYPYPLPALIRRKPKKIFRALITFSWGHYTSFARFAPILVPSFVFGAFLAI